MSDPLSLRDAISRRVRRAVVARRLSPEDVGQRTGLHPRTVERALDGETFNVDTLDAIARSMRIGVVEEEAEPILGGLPLWQLRDSLELWARLADVALLLEVTRQAVYQRVDAALRSGNLHSEHVRRRVRDSDAMVRSPYHWLTKRPGGCTVLTCQASVWLLLTSEGAPGQRARSVLVEERARIVRAGGGSR